MEEAREIYRAAQSAYGRAEELCARGRVAVARICKRWLWGTLAYEYLREFGPSWLADALDWAQRVVW